MTNRAKPDRFDGSIVKKSVARICSQCLWWNSFQVVFRARSGDGSMPCLFRMFPDRVVCQIVTQVGQCSLDPSIAPGAILLSHADSQSSNFLARWMPTGSSTPIPSVVFGNQFSVPRQQSFRRGDGRHLPQHLSPKLFGFRRQSPSLVIVELETPVTHLFSKDPILLDQI